jgi:hypothetical protein
MLGFDDSFAFIWFHRRFITPKRVRKREKREGEDVPPSPSKLPQNKQTTRRDKRFEEEKTQFLKR